MEKLSDETCIGETTQLSETTINSAKKITMWVNKTKETSQYRRMQKILEL